MSKKMNKNLSHVFSLDSIAVVEAPIGTDPATLIEQAKRKLIQQIQEDECCIVFENFECVEKEHMMSKKMKAYEIRYRPDEPMADMKNVVVVSVSKSQAIIDLVNEDNVYWVDNIRKLTEFEVDTSTNNLGK